MKIYADTSFLVSLYLAGEVNHSAASHEVGKWRIAPELPLTPFGAVEIENTLARLQYRGRIHVAEGRAVMRDLLSDIGTGLLVSAPLPAYEWLEKSRDLVRAITPRTGTRTLDCLHIALAKQSGCTHLASFDVNQRKAAAAAGLKSIPA